MVLIDTSLWIESFRRNPSVRISALFQPEEICIVLPVFQEVLQGIRADSAFTRARNALRSARFVENPLEISVFEDAADLYRLARKKGLTIRSGTDCLIAACAIRNGLTVAHRDRDFPALARISALKERAY